MVPPADYDKVADQPLFLDELRARSAARVAADPEFAYLQDNLRRMTERLKRNTISLNANERRAELEEIKSRKKARVSARAEHPLPERNVFEITLDNVNKPELERAKLDKKPKAQPKSGGSSDEDEEDENPVVDPVRIETVNIATDLVELSRAPTTASTKQAATN